MKTFNSTQFFYIVKNWMMVTIICMGWGMVSCTDKTDNIPSPSQQEMEKDLIGLWYEDFDYKDVTEKGKPFNRAMITMEVKADHTGYVALSVFDDEFNEPLETYGGPTNAPFTWQVTADGDIILDAPKTNKTLRSAGTDSTGNHNNFVDIGQMNLNCNQGTVTFSNASHKGTLTKADSGKSDLIQDWMAKSTLPPACITDSIPVLISDNLMNYVFNYPSIDPFGNPCTLSGTITVDKSLIKDNKSFNGILLYNHFTIYATTQAPSRGAVEFPTGAALTNFIVVAPDYYGFGITEKEPQAYCISRANGRASLDAYLAAKRMIEDLKVKKGDDFVIAGYSEGAQTTIGVLREISERHPEVKVKRAFAGDGPYDINSMYDAISKGNTEMPSTVCNVLYAFNYFFRLGYGINDYLKDPVAKNFEEWFLSKKYKRKALDEELIKTKKTGDFCTAAVLDTNSPLSLRFKETFREDALTSGWTPRSDLDVMLFHDTNDDVVPVENFYAMSKFLKDHDIKTQEFVGEYSSATTKELGITNHETSALTFFLRIIEWMRANY
jgi:pimeloyl-ACP methyl ester carboxylesterase